MTNEMRDREYKDIERRIRILENGITRELNKNYKREENRQKKIAELNKRITFWNNRLANI